MNMIYLFTVTPKKLKRPIYLYIANKFVTYQLKKFRNKFIHKLSTTYF